MLWKNKHKQQKTTVFPGTFVEPKNMNIGNFLEKLSKLLSKAVVFHSYSEHCTSFVPNYNHQNKQNSLQNPYSKNNLNLNGNELNLTIN